MRTILLLHTCLFFLLLAAQSKNVNGTQCPSETTKTATDSNDSTSSSSSSSPLKFYIDGSWVNPKSTTTTTPRLIDVIDPSTGTPIASIPLATPSDIDTAITAAQHAFPAWSLHTTPAQRQTLLHRLLQIYNERTEEMALAISREMGAPIDFAREVQTSAGSYPMEVVLDILEKGYFEFEGTVPGAGGGERDDDYDDNEEEEENDAKTTIWKEPIGVVAMITPWNWPIYQITMKVIPALAVGCTCILKPSEQSPLSAQLFAQMVHDAGIPPGVFNMIHGDGETTGSYLAGHTGVDMISFTGSTAVGVAVTKGAADTLKRVSLELGGKGAFVIFADALDDDSEEYYEPYEEEDDILEGIVSDGVHSSFGNTGQNCNAPTRMLVERSIYPRAIEIAALVAAGIRVGSAHDGGDDDHLGPVVSLSQYDRIQRYIAIGIEEGARLVAGGLGRPPEMTEEGDGSNSSGGFYVRPTVFADCDVSMRIMREEIFGPVLCIAPFDSEEEVIDIVNDTKYGLENYVYSSNRARRIRMARAIRSGMVQMNGVEQDFGSPFGGMKTSGTGREGGVWGMEEFCEVKAVTGI